MSIYKQLVNIVESEKKDNRYQYGCAMLYFEFPEMRNLHSMIKEDEIYAPEEGGYGLEHEPHITLLFGLHPHEVDPAHVMNACKSRQYKDVSLKGLSLFKNDKFEVLKFDADGDDLHHVNGILSQYPHTTDYPDYHPHATVAYLKPGAGDQVLKRIRMGKPYNITPKQIVYSTPDRNKITENL